MDVRSSKKRLKDVQKTRYLRYNVYGDEQRLECLLEGKFGKTLVRIHPFFVEKVHLKLAVDGGILGGKGYKIAVEWCGVQCDV